MIKPPFASTQGRRPSRFASLLSRSSFQVSFITFIAVTLIIVKLGGHGLANYDDCFYADKAKEILRTGDWMTMRYNGRPAFENPPFYMWLAAGSYTIFGVNEYGAKFPSAVMGVGTILLVYFFGRMMFDAWTGFASSMILATTFIFTRYARHAMLDVTLSFFVCLAFFALMASIKKNHRYFLLWGLSIAGCVLIKSVLGFFPLVISIVFLLFTKRWRMLADMYFISGTVIAVALGCSWYLNQYLAFGQEFIRVHFEWLIVQRGLQGHSESLTDHLSYAEDLLQYYQPWLIFLTIGIVQCFGRSLKRDDNALLLLLWVLVIFVTMSLMSTRVLWYIMPIFPASAMIVGNVFGGFLKDRGRILFGKIAVAVGVVTFVVLIATPIQLEADREIDVRTIAPAVKHFADAGAKVVAFRCSYYGLNNALLFYSDHAASPIVHEFGELENELRNSDTILCVMNSSDLDSAMRVSQSIHLLQKTDELALVSNKQLDMNPSTLR